MECTHLAQSRAPHADIIAYHPRTILSRFVQDVHYLLAHKSNFCYQIIRKRGVTLDSHRPLALIVMS